MSKLYMSISDIKNLLTNVSQTYQSLNKQRPFPGALTKPPALPVDELGYGGDDVHM